MPHSRRILDLRSTTGSFEVRTGVQVTQTYYLEIAANAHGLLVLSLWLDHDARPLSRSARLPVTNTKAKPDFWSFPHRSRLRLTGPNEYPDTPTRLPDCFHITVGKRLCLFSFAQCFPFRTGIITSITEISQQDPFT
jgi:hypothetical protein